MKPLLGKNPLALFATRTVGGHLIRGAVAFALLWAAIGQQHAHPNWSMLAALLALVAMRGCPACWTIGLVEAISQGRRGGDGLPLRRPDRGADVTEGSKVPVPEAVGSSQAHSGTDSVTRCT